MAQLNKEQEKAVLQMDNAVVAAGAGSGKTFVLAQRYSHLVLEKGFTVDQILTLTFTNKAAAEMYQRIYKTLFEFSQKNPDNKRAKLAVQNFSEARIQTLDSYCSSIINLHLVIMEYDQTFLLMMKLVLITHTNKQFHFC